MLCPLLATKSRLRRAVSLVEGDIDRHGAANQHRDRG